jgi:hypothetical protein
MLESSTTKMPGKIESATKDQRVGRSTELARRLIPDQPTRMRRAAMPEKLREAPPRDSNEEQTTDAKANDKARNFQASTAVECVSCVREVTTFDMIPPGKTLRTPIAV